MKYILFSLIGILIVYVLLCAAGSFAIDSAERRMYRD